MRTFERWQQLKPGERVSVPVAIMVSKSDLLAYAISPQEQALCRFLQDTTYYGKVNQEDLHTVNLHVRTFLAKLGENRLLLLSQRYKKAHFFACSATGGSADAQGDYQQVKPRRCLDPFIWLLGQLGSLK